MAGEQKKGMLSLKSQANEQRWTSNTAGSQLVTGSVLHMQSTTVGGQMGQLAHLRSSLQCPDWLQEIMHMQNVGIGGSRTPQPPHTGRVLLTAAKAIMRPS